jgi:flap endonuclease-1
MLYMSKFFLGDNNRGNFSIGREKGKFGFIDALNRIYKQSIGLISRNINLMDKDESNLHIASIFNFTIYMLKYGILPIYVFDGKCPKEKRQVVAKRRNDKKIFRQKCDDIEDKSSPEFIKNFRRGFSLSKEQIDECKKVLDLMGLKYVNAPEEADQQCASLAFYYKNDSVGVISDDWDILMYGSPIILKEFTFKNPNNSTIKIEKEEILKSCLLKANYIRERHGLENLLNFTHENFLDFCILMGTDYTVNDKLFKIDNITHDELFEFCSLDGFDMRLVAQTLYASDKITSAEDFLFSLVQIREIYNNSRIIKPENVQIIPDRINIDELVNFLCAKGMDKIFVESEIKSIEMSYYSLKKIAESLNNPRSFCNLKSYQYKHYCEQFKKNSSVNDKSVCSIPKEAYECQIPENIKKNIGMNYNGSKVFRQYEKKVIFPIASFRKKCDFNFLINSSR